MTICVCYFSIKGEMTSAIALWAMDKNPVVFIFSLASTKPTEGFGELAYVAIREFQY